ncbi:MAG TPA: UDP-3-O-acyl-N-acetylglucosamine deacetylase [Terriglobia bacterium]|nr:UDP-3-O-acyl-N-acetylglucosamine deacetylase [Terriglobia bacterium]
MILAHQNTIATPVSVSGIGLHTGVEVKLRLRAAPANRGIVFRRTDLEGFEIEARARNVARVSYATSLMRKGVLISTTEHLLSALTACGVDNACVEIDNLEVPILDGSALPFVRLIQKAGLKRQRAWRVYARLLRPVEVVEGGKRIAAYPSDPSSDHLAVSYHIAFPHPVIGEQSFEYVQSEAHVNGRPSRYETEIAPARTFGFLDEVERLRQSGLVRGGSLENAVVLTRDGVMNAEGLRFPDEFCRHKILDLIGDLSLFGHPLIGHIVAERAGHAMHAALVTKLLRERTAWELTGAELVASSRPRASRPVATLTALDGTV